MRWTPGGPSADLEDERGSSGGGGGGNFGRLGIGGFLVLLVLSFIFKRDFFALVGGGGVYPLLRGHIPRRTYPHARQAQVRRGAVEDDEGHRGAYRAAQPVHRSIAPPGP